MPPTPIPHLRPSAVGLLLCCLFQHVAASLSGRVSVPKDTHTSAGVYDADGRLLRTLWSRRPTSAGTHELFWDGGAVDSASRDVALPAATGARFRVLDVGGVSYTWEGVVGNSIGMTGPTIPKGYNPVLDMSIAGDVASIAVGYAERVRSMFVFNASAPPGTAAGSFRTIGHMDYHRQFEFTATDGKIAAFSNRSPTAAPPSYYNLNLTMIVGYDVTSFDDNAPPWCEHNYTIGGQYSCQEGYGQGPCNDMWDGCNGHEQTYSSAIDVGEDGNFTDGDYADAGTGMAMFVGSGASAVLLAAHGHKATLRAFDKVNGQFLRSWTDPVGLLGLRTLSVPASELPDQDCVYAVTAPGVTRLCGLSSPAPLAITIIVPAGGPTLLAPGDVAISPNGTLLLVTDVDPSRQQVLIFDAASGALLRTFGLAGGYLASSDLGVAVAPTTRFWFSAPTESNMWGSQNVSGSVVAWVPDGASFWVSDMANRRMLRLSAADGAYVDDISWLLCSYKSFVPPAEPTRVFSNFLEFEVDYSLPLDAPGAWRLLYNWGAGTPPQLAAWDYGTDLSGWAFAGFSSMTTLVDAAHGGISRTFAVVTWYGAAPYNHSGDASAIVELVRPASPALGLCPNGTYPPPPGGAGGGLRFVHIFPPTSDLRGGVLEADGTLRYGYNENNPAGNGSFWQGAYAIAPTIDDAGCVSWLAATPALLAAVNVSSNNSQSLMARGSMSTPRFPTTADGTVVFFDANRNVNGGMHLGGVAPAPGGGPGRSWSWTASPWGKWDQVDNITYLQPGNVSVNLRYINASTIDGRFGADDCDPSQCVNFAGSWAMTESSNILYGFYGEGWYQSEANQMLHFHESGLFIGQYGIPAAPSPEGNTVYATPQVAGNTFSPSLVRSVGADGAEHLYQYNNEEVEHGGVHRWRIDGADGVRELTVVYEG